jgi:two-component system sensor histidine kinase QseC
VKSIRVFLTISIIAIITLVIFLSVLRGYQSSMLEAENLFDSKLSDTIKLLAFASNPEATGNPSELATEKTVFQIWKDENTLIHKSVNAPTSPISKFESGYSLNNFNNYRWKTLTYFDSRQNRWLILAERSDTRYVLAEEIILKSIMPTVFVLPLLALIIWYVTGYGLNSLNKLAKELGNKKADNLSPIDIDTPPEELAQVVDSTNTLLARLESSFKREHQFSSDAAHELRTPISILKVHLYNLSEQYPENDNVKVLGQGFDRLGHLLEQLLSLYRSSPDQFSANFEKIDLDELVQIVIAEEFSQIDDRNQEVSLDGEETTIVGDDFALKTMIKNLLTNASKYTPKGGKIRVSIERGTSGVNLIIEDSGPGIHKSLRKRVFDRFYRVNSDRHGSGQTGCGLGLSIVRHIVELHNGSIELTESGFLGGLKVMVFFPKDPLDPIKYSKIAKQG